MLWRALSCIFFVFSFLSAIVCADDGLLYFIKDSKPVATIVKPANAPKWTNIAIEWLQEYIHKATGQRLDVVTEGNEISAGTLISVGHTVLATKAGIDGGDLKYDGCRMVVKGNTLFLLGKDATGEV